MTVMLKPQDVLILLKLIAWGETEWSYSSLAFDLFMSPSEVHSGLKRAGAARLIDLRRRRPIRKAMEEFIIHGVKYAYPPNRGEMTRGMPTCHAGPPLKSMLLISDDEPLPVWPDPEGAIRGYAFSPLYKSVPRAAAKDPRLYELLVLVDGIRDGRARERALAIREIRSRLRAHS
jgi:hypothetical protein